MRIPSLVSAWHSPTSLRDVLRKPWLSLAAQHTRLYIMLPGEVGEFVKLALHFVHLRLEYGQGRIRSYADGRFVERDTWLSNAILGLRQRFLLLLKIRRAPVELRLQLGGLLGIPFGIVEPGLINRI